jgi:putative membrane protein
MKNKVGIRTINVISVVVVLLVMVMLGLRQKPYIGEWTKQLTFVNAIINSLTALSLILGLVFIRQRNIAAHKLAMSSGFTLGGLFLVFYVLYHISNEETRFGGEGGVRYFYFFVLITHVLASFVVLPLVLRAYYYGWIRDDERHRKVVKYAYPIWLYVSITGVIAYLMIRPYYTF